MQELYILYTILRKVGNKNTKFVTPGLMCKHHVSFYCWQIKLIVAPRDRAILHEKIAQRFKLMLAQGFVAEVEALYRRGDLTVQMPSVRAVGYRQVWSYLDGEINLQEVQELGVIATRQLAKRQFTWLRREVDAETFYTEDSRVFERVFEVVAQRIG